MQQFASAPGTRHKERWPASLDGAVVDVASADKDNGGHAAASRMRLRHPPPLAELMMSMHTPFKVIDPTVQLIEAVALFLDEVEKQTRYTTCPLSRDSQLKCDDLWSR